MKERTSFHSYLHSSTLYHLKLRAAIEDRSQSSIIEEALADYFAKFDDSQLMAQYDDNQQKEGKD